LLVGLSAGRCLFGGKEFLAGPGQQVVPDQLIVGLQPGADINQIIASAVPQAVAKVVGSHWNTYLLNLPPGFQATVSKLLAASPLVKYVEPNRIRHTTVIPPNDPMITEQWDLTTLQAVRAWSYLPDHYLTAASAGTGAGRVKVALIDTGVDCTHPDFMNAGGTSTNSAQGGQLDWADSKAIEPTTVSSPACPWEDSNGHGTHTGGTIAAGTDNGTGVASVGYPLQIIVYQVFQTIAGQYGASDADIATAIDNAISAGAQVISMSLGGPGYSQTMQTAMDWAWQNNVLVVASAGNSGDNSLQYPAGGNHVLGVAATDSNNAYASFSTYGNWIKIAGPGVNVLSTLPTYAASGNFGTNYGVLSGTSMATPHVAAVAGLLYMLYPDLSVADIAQRLQQTARTPYIGWDQHIGYGVVNAGAALGGSLPSATQGSVVGQVVDSSNFPITGAQVTAGSQSFTTAVDPNTGDANGLFRIANLSPGTYTITVTAPGYSAVTMQAAVVAGADTMLTIQMGVTLGQFTGAVTCNGVAVPGAAVEAMSGGLNEGTALTDSTGAYAITVRPGTYTLTASAPNYIDATPSTTAVGSSGAVTVNLALSMLGNISGTVVDANGQEVSGAQIDFTGAGFSGGAMTGAKGSFSTFGIPAGTYTVTASASGYGSVTHNGVIVNATGATPVFLQFSTGTSLTSGLLGYWPINEDSGSVAHDVSGNGNDATLANTTWTTGKFTYGLSFNGSNSEGITPAIAFTNTFSISAWVNPAVSRQVTDAEIAETNYSGFSLQTDSTGIMYQFLINNGTGSTGTCGQSLGCALGGTVTSGWHLVTGTYDGTTAILYLDGVALASDTFTAPANASLPLYMGLAPNGSGAWNGAMDEVRLYNRALTASEVSALFNFTSAPNLNISKTADATAVPAGMAMGYTVTVSNNSATGTATATSAALNDPLPAGTGVNWSISPTYSGPGTCTITGAAGGQALGCSFGNLAAGTTATVHVTSSTSTSSCAEYTNTATVTASNSSSLESNATLTVECPAPGSQTITFGALSNEPFGTAPFAVSATASSGLAVSFSAATPAFCTVAGATVTLVAAGTCTIQATQGGSTNWAAATAVNQSFQVTKGSQTIAFGTLSNQPFGTAPFAVSATASSGLTVSFGSTTPAVCTVSGSTVTLVAAGICTIQATQGGSTNWADATAVNQSFQVTKGSQTIAFGTLSNQPFGTAPFAVSATASSGLTVSFGSTTPAVCTVSGSTVTLVAAGTCTSRATQVGNTNWAAATPVSQSFQVTHGSQTINFGALTNQPFGTAPFAVSASVSSGLPVSFNSQTTSVCTVSGSTVTLVSGGTCTIQATQAGNTNYAAATPVNQSFQVTPAPQTLTFGAFSNQVFGTAPFTVSATASSGLPVSFNSQTTSVCTVSGTMVTLVSGGTCTIQATQGGNNNYAAATPVDQAAVTYLVGDVFPYTSDTAPNFGSGVLNILDLIQILFAVNNVPGFTPAVCSDRFNAMDAYPLDTATTRGGDGVLDIRDLIVELFRVNNLDPSRPVRTSLGGCASNTGQTPASQTAQSAASSGRNAARRAVEVRGTLVLGSPENSAGGERVAVYLQAGRDLVGVAVTFGLGDQQSPLQFVNAADPPPSLVQDSQVGVVALAWLQGVTVRAGERFLLGYVAGPPGWSAKLKVFGVSAGGLNDNQEVGLDVSGAAGPPR